MRYADLMKLTRKCIDLERYCNLKPFVSDCGTVCSAGPPRNAQFLSAALAISRAKVVQGGKAKPGAASETFIDHVNA